MAAPPDRRTGEPPQAGFHRREIAALALVIVACAWFYFGSALCQPNTSFSRSPGGYYGLLTAGFRSGHLYAAIEPHPALLALKDPYDPVANAPYRVHDMTLWHGKYYLYFGATPVLILFWPVAALTGYYPTEALAIALFAYVGFCAAVALLAAIRRRYYSNSPDWVLPLAALCVGIGSPVALLTQSPQFYQVPIAAAFCLHLLMLGAIYLALHSPRRGGWWLATASLLYGLAVGARPNYVLGGVALGLPLAWLLSAPRRRGRIMSARALGLVAATCLPAAFCGAGLLAYNWLRFGSPWEFGMRYQLAGEKFLALEPIGLRNLWPHLGEYLFAGGFWSPYFPFFSHPVGELQGMLRYSPWLWLACWALVPRRGSGQGGPRTVFAVTVFCAVAANLGLLACFFGITERYPSDFAPAWFFLAGIGALALTDRTTASPKERRIASMAIVVVAAWSLFTGLATFARSAQESQGLLALARVCNRPAYLWEKAHHVEYGTLRMSVVLPTGREGWTEPLLQTGVSADRRDWLLIEYLPGRRARIGFFHAGLGQLNGKEFDVPADGRIVVVVRCGSLLPPWAHPVFSGWDRAAYELARRDLAVSVNGVETLRAVLECYDSPPSALRIAALDWPGGSTSPRFSGMVTAVSRLPLSSEPSATPSLGKRLPVEVTTYLPADRMSGSEPLLVTGRGAQSDLLYCTYVGRNRIRFGFDHYGKGGPLSDPTDFDPLQPHVLTIWLGSLSEAGPNQTPDAANWAGRLLVLFDGKVMLNVRQVFYPSSPETAVLGVNVYESTLASPRFGGRVTDVRFVDFTGLPPAPSGGVYGAIEMNLFFPRYPAATAEPLVTTGRAGAGDLIYVRYLDARHVSFGFDHWGVGGIVGEPEEIDLSRPHHIALTMGSLYSPETSTPGLRTRVEVQLDGRIVLQGQSSCHPSTPADIQLLANAIGASTCGPVFNGQIVTVKRSPEPDF